MAGVECGVGVVFWEMQCLRSGLESEMVADERVLSIL